MILCNVCGCDTASILIEKNGYKVYRCPSCGLAFTYPQPQSIADQYDSDYFSLYRKRHGFRVKRGDHRLAIIELLKQPGNLLDIGCSLGYFLEAANSRGWRACGMDISPAACKRAESLGLDVRAGVLVESTYPTGSFDCVTMWDVLEHVPDPTKHMLCVHNILNDGGLVAIGTPDIGHINFRIKQRRWRHLKPGEHLYYFERSTLQRLLEKTGFSVVTAPIVGRRKFAGSTIARARCVAQQIIQPNDVMVMYGVKNGL